MRSRLLRLPSLFALLALLTPPLAPALHAQRAQRSAIAPVDSSARRCLDVGWLHASASCEGRVLNASALALMGGSGGALAGLVGGVVAPTRCLGHAEKNAVRGAIAGAALGAATGVVVRHVSRRDRAARDARAREAARNDPPRPWSWRDVRPAVVALGVMAATGAAIGGVQGLRDDGRCSGAGGGMATGAGVYAASGATALMGTLLVVRFLF